MGVKAIVQKALNQIGYGIHGVKIKKASGGLSESRVYSVYDIHAERAFIVKIFPAKYETRIKNDIEGMIYVKNFHIPVPEIFFHQNNFTTQGDGILIVEKLEGETLFTLLQLLAIPKEALISAGKYLKILHMLPLTNDWQNSAEVIPTKEEILEKLQRSIEKNIGEIVKIEDVSVEEKWLRRYFDNFLSLLSSSEIDICLLHGDYNPQNILIRNNQVQGIIDFELKKIGHSLQELGIVYYWLKFYEKNFESSLLFKSFLEGYDEKSSTDTTILTIIEGYYLLQILSGITFLEERNIHKEDLLRLKHLLAVFCRATISRNFHQIRDER